MLLSELLLLLLLLVLLLLELLLLSILLLLLRTLALEIRETLLLLPLREVALLVSINLLKCGVGGCGIIVIHPAARAYHIPIEAQESFTTLFEL